MILLSTIQMILSLALTQIENKTAIFSRISLIILFFSIYLSYKTFFFSSLINIIPLFNGTIKYDIYNSIFSLFVLILAFFIYVLTSFYPISNYINKSKGIKSIILLKIYNHFKITEYCLLLLFIISGSIFLMLNNDIINLFLGIELQSYGLYLLATIYKNSENATRAGLTYFLLGGLSSCIILLGLALLYANMGNTSLENIYIIYDLSNQLSYSYELDKLDNSSNYIYSYLYLYTNNIDIIILIVTVGLLFKISAAPFHF